MCVCVSAMSLLYHFQVYSGANTSLTVPAAPPGSSCVAKVRALQKITVNQREETLFSTFSPIATCDTPLPVKAKEEKKQPLAEVKNGLNALDYNSQNLRKQQGDHQLKIIVLMVALVGFGVVVAILIAQFIG